MYEIRKALKKLSVYLMQLFVVSILLSFNVSATPAIGQQNQTREASSAESNEKTKPSQNDPAKEDSTLNKPAKSDLEKEEPLKDVNNNSAQAQSEKSEEQTINSPPPKKTIALKPYTAHYDILDGKEDVGTATRKLSLKGDIWTLSQSTSIKRWYYKYFFEETSEFQLKDGHMYAKAYQSLTKRSFKDDRRIKSLFNWSAKKETGEYDGKDWEMDLTQHVFDHLSYQIGLRLRASQQNSHEYLRVSYKGERSNYHFVNEGFHTIDTPLGKYKTILWTQQPQYKSDKIFYLWLAPELNYIPVQMAQIRDGKTEGTIRLKRLDFE
ncbi:MAG: DUF3108 domain-containing protein [Gammaproteobacteria bacterium]|nr:DUF3108 domain-containing protein [Gammaproteobacteria bacterium]